MQSDETFVHLVALCCRFRRVTQGTLLQCLDVKNRLSRVSQLNAEPEKTTK